MDNELYELCKEVYKRTKWGQFGDEGLKYFNEELNVARKDMPPIYTSDYLLEKLPIHLNEGTIDMVYELDEDNRPWCYGYHYDKFRVQLNNGSYAQGWGGTPLKALLKLTIALDDAGVKL